MAEALKTRKMLFTKQAVVDYMGQGEAAVLSLIKKGLPVRIEGRRWFAYVDNLEAWMQRWTLVSYEGQELPEDSE
ncbi:hypothetical protein LCGC14_1850280 [marine sediment metagenome]|uniref:Helix-turn-helix domain-containing protein n=1 Tax=marine sediment metagenome TaxID=412755 RepID=A0A0F9IQ52_9ZZZZ|nr:hypothetical protein [Desulfobacterales bacterium]